MPWSVIYLLLKGFSDLVTAVVMLMFPLCKFIQLHQVFAPASSSTSNACSLTGYIYVCSSLAFRALVMLDCLHMTGQNVFATMLHAMLLLYLHHKLILGLLF